MDYITIVVNAIVAFFKAFKIDDIAKAYAAIHFDGLKDACLAIVEALQKVIG